MFREPSRSFVMPPAGEALEADTVIDISHESLMRVWERLQRGWRRSRVGAAVPPPGRDGSAAQAGQCEPVAGPRPAIGAELVTRKPHTGMGRALPRRLRTCDRLFEASVALRDEEARETAVRLQEKKTNGSVPWNWPRLKLRSKNGERKPSGCGPKSRNGRRENRQRWPKSCDGCSGSRQRWL